MQAYSNPALPEVIRDVDGNIVKQSHNLRGIREYVSTHLISTLSIERIAHGEGKLCILFDDGESYETNFADFAVLRDFVRRWRNVYGAPLLVDGVNAGKVDYRNSQLIEANHASIL